MEQKLMDFKDVVFPIIKIKVLDDLSIQNLEFLGTGFFIGNEGFFLTVKHVLNKSLFDKLAENEKIAVQLMDKTIKAMPIDFLEEYENNVDLTLGHVNFIPQYPNFFNISNESQVYGWHDLHVFGFPGYLVEDIPLKGLFLKGYLTREIMPGEMLGIQKVSFGCYSMSFPIPKGMSGSPVFRTGQIHPLVGICLGSYEISTTLWENSYLETNGEKITERNQRIIENGIALKIFALKDWYINSLNKRLIEIF
jgi:hypothetical protein